MYGTLYTPLVMYSLIRIYGALNLTPVNPSTRLSALSADCQTLSPPGYNLVDRLTGVGLSEVDCMWYMLNYTLLIA